MGHIVVDYNEYKGIGIKLMLSTQSFGFANAFVLSFAILLLTGCNELDDNENNSSSTSSSTSGALNSSTSSSSGNSSTSTSSSSGNTSSGLVSLDRPRVKFRSNSVIAVREGVTTPFYKPEIVGLNEMHDNGVMYTIQGGDSERFNIDTSTGEITFKSPPNTANPKDLNSDNRYQFFLQVSSVGNIFEAKSIEMIVNVAEMGPVNVVDLEWVFPPAGSRLGKGVDTEIEVVVRVKLNSGELSNIQSVTANGQSLTPSYREQGLWVGKAPIGTGDQLIEMKVTDAMGESYSFNGHIQNLPIASEVTDAVFTQDGESLYLLDINQRSIFKVGIDDQSVQVVTGPHLGNGPVLSNVSAILLDDANTHIYGVLTSEMDARDGIIAVDLSTGERSMYFWLPEGLKLLQRYKPIVLDGDLITWVYDVTQRSNKIIRIKSSELEVIFDSAELASEERICGGRALFGDSTDNIVYTSGTQCSTGFPIIVSFNLSNGERTVVLTADGEFEDFDEVSRVLRDDTNNRIYLSGHYHILYEVNLDEKTITSGTEASYEDLYIGLSNDQKLVGFSTEDWSIKSKKSILDPWSIEASLAFVRPSEYYVNDIDIDEGTLAMVSPSQVVTWDPTDLSSQSHWTNLTIDNGQPSNTAYYMSHYLRGIELDKSLNRYYVYQENLTRQDFIGTLRLEMLEVDLIGNVVDREIVAEHTNGFGPPLRKNYRLDSKGTEVFYSSNAVLDLMAEPTPGDASVEGDIGIYVQGATVGEQYIFSSEKNVITEYALAPYVNFVAVTHDAKNSVAYALSDTVALRKAEHGYYLYAISLFGGQKVLMGGSMPEQYRFTSSGNNGSSSSSGSSFSESSSSSSSSDGIMIKATSLSNVK